MLENQKELDEALSRPVGNETTDMTELEGELEELLKQPVLPTPIPAAPIPAQKEVVSEEYIKPPEQDPFADLELRLQKLGVKECRLSHSMNFLSLILCFSNT